MTEFVLFPSSYLDIGLFTSRVVASVLPFIYMSLEVILQTFLVIQRLSAHFTNLWSCQYSVPSILLYADCAETVPHMVLKRLGVFSKVYHLITSFAFDTVCPRVMGHHMFCYFCGKSLPMSANLACVCSPEVTVAQVLSQSIMCFGLKVLVTNRTRSQDCPLIFPKFLRLGLFGWQGQSGAGIFGIFQGFMFNLRQPGVGICAVSHLQDF